MAEFLTMDEAKSKFGTKGRTNAGLTLGIIGTALAAFAGTTEDVVVVTVAESLETSLEVTTTVALCRQLKMLKP